MYKYLLLDTFIPKLPGSLLETIIFVVAILGAFLISYAVFIEKERRQDLILVIGAFCLLIYALSIRNAIFSIAMGGFFLSSLVEFTEIYLGLHKHHKEELKRLKTLK